MRLPLLLLLVLLGSCSPSYRLYDIYHAPRPARLHYQHRQRVNERLREQNRIVARYHFPD